MKATIRAGEHGAGAELRIEGTSSTGDDISLAGGTAGGPSPEELLAAGLASCTATTMELYARRKGWDIGQVEVDADYEPAQRGSPTCCTIVVRLPDHVTPERRERLMQVGATSRVHRILEGEIVFDERVELIASHDAACPENGSRSPRSTSSC